MSPDSVEGAPGLLEAIRQEIGAAGPMTFARFMELALHHPEHGYYARGPQRLGPSGDYFTAADLGPDFGRCLARLLGKMSDRVPGESAFTVVEYGGGRGLLAADVQAAWDRRRSLDYVVVDSSAGMRRLATEVAPHARVVSPGQEGGDHDGCALAVELFDALPVHRLRRRKGRLREVFVDSDPAGRLVEREGRPVPVAAELAARYGAAAEEGSEAEVCPAAMDQLDRMAGCLRRGFLLIVDYGYEARRLYGPSHRRGTLLAYHRHATNEDVLRRVGGQDLTAHVNWTSLEDHAGDLGLRLLGRVPQWRLLLGLDVLAPFEETDERVWNDPAQVKRRLQIRQLVHPSGMGGRFEALALAKDLPDDVRLAAFDEADPRSRR